MLNKTSFNKNIKPIKSNNEYKKDKKTVKNQVKLKFKIKIQMIKNSQNQDLKKLL